MQWRPGLKDGGQQVVRQLRIDGDAALDVVPQADLTLDRDDRSCLLRRQHRRRDDDFLDGLPGRFLTIEVAEERRLAEVRQRAADVGLEDHDGREDHVDQHVADHPVEGLQRGEPRQVEQHDDQQRAYRHLNGTSSPDQFQELVNQIETIAMSSRSHQPTGGRSRLVR